MFKRPSTHSRHSQFFRIRCELKADTAVTFAAKKNSVEWQVKQKQKLKKKNIQKLLWNSDVRFFDFNSL